jgi:hypothetical protein
MLATLAPASTRKLRKMKYWLVATGNVSEHYLYFMSKSVLMVGILILLPRASGFEIIMGDEKMLNKKLIFFLWFYLAEQAQLCCCMG